MRQFMSDFKAGLESKSKSEKVAFIIGLLSSIIVIVFAIIQLTGVWRSAIVFCEVFMGISMICQAILNWKRNRSIAIFSVIVAVFIFAVAFVVLFLG